MVRPTIPSAVAALALLAAPLARGADFSVAGPYAFTESPPPAGLLPGNTDISVFTPNTAGQYPLVVATHGWSAGRVNQLGWAKHLASYGYVVIVPGMPNPFAPDQAAWSANIRTIATNAVNPGVAPQIAAKVDATKIVYEGFSAGGLASTLAAKDKPPTLLVLLDPVDNAQNLGAAAVRSICVPVLNFFTQPSGCNSQSGWSTFAANVGGSLVRMGIKFSTHCDGEDEARALCGPFCGGAAKTENRDTIRKYMVAYLEWKLRGNAEAAALFAPGALAANDKIENTSVLERSSCGSAADAGPSPVDAGTAVDAGSVADAGASVDARTPVDAATSVDATTPPDASQGADAAPIPPLDAGQSPVDAGTTIPVDAGTKPVADADTLPSDNVVTQPGGCSCRTAPNAKLSPLLLLLGLLPLARRRRNR